MPDEHARVFPEARRVLHAFLDEVDRHAPGHLTGAYIVGSLALGDPRPGKSDIDLVLVRADDATNEASMEALSPAMDLVRASYPTPALDGMVLSREDLRAGPVAMLGPRPKLFEGTLTLSDDSSGRTPVTWQTLRQGGITWFGTPVSDLDLHDNPDELREWTRGNLESYWRPWLAKSRRLPSLFGFWSLRPDFVEWGVLGVTRLHYTLATGEVTSKAGAGAYALAAFPERWHRIIREATGIRMDPDQGVSRYGRNALRRRRDARAYIAMVIEDALAL